MGYNANRKKLVLYGAGYVGKQYVKKIGKEKIYAFADSNEKIVGEYILGKKVLSEEELYFNKENIFLYPSVSWNKWESVIQSIVQQGLEKCIVYSPYFTKVKAGFHAYQGLNCSYEGNNFFDSYSYIDNSQIGYASYVGAYSKIDGAIIGRYTSIGPNVYIVKGQHPTHKFVSTHPAFYSINHVIELSYVEHQLFDEFRYIQDKISIKVGNDVWIGDGVKIMEGVTIADGTIVAAGANVVKDTEPYSIVGGNPARPIRYRFNEEQIKFLLDLKWWNKPENWIDEYAKYFDNIATLQEQIGSVRQ